MRYKIKSRSVGARHCRAPTGVPHVNEKRYMDESSSKVDERSSEVDEPSSEVDERSSDVDK
ncbi:hypothetical protein [Nostoc sp. 'Peltigera membranacea cyanobiont' 213]|uniref:hypothetical protein n=1 Tax=Nostoc sp. 'Peltigera membranacea cyanobiont' 213 TaxID=2014530 RepID=UPI00167D49AA|nr:hypothetical protein [Nostoc sp. 'Peltigera membranacea cyanobiont' 213]